MSNSGVSNRQTGAPVSGTANVGAPARTAAQIEKDLDQTRDRLAGTIASLEQRINPRAVLDRSVAQAKGRIKDFYLDEHGSVRPDRVAMTAGAVVVGVIGLRVTFKGLRWLTAVPEPKLPDSDVVYIPVARDQLALLGQYGPGPLAITAA